MLTRNIEDGLRAFSRAPGFALVATLTLGLGIGAAVTMFSVMEAVLWRPMPYPNAERLVLLDGRGASGDKVGLSPLDLAELRQQTRTLDAVASISGVDANLDIDGELERVYAVSASDDALRMLGAEPFLGRFVDDRRDIGATGSISAVVISDGLWRRRFGGDPSVVGRFIQVNNIRAQVVGVLRPGLKLFLPAEWNANEDVDVWFPAGVNRDLAPRVSRLARLAPGVSLARAQAELDGLSSALAAARPQAPAGWRMVASPLQAALTENVKPALVTLAAAVAFVLLISCVNVMNLILARGKEREREFAVREVLGARRSRLIMQLLTESGTLAVLACATGLLLAGFSVELTERLGEVQLPRQSQLGIDATAALFAAVVAVVACFAVGLLPAVRATYRTDLTILSTGRIGAAGRGVRRLQRALVVAEVALSIVPLVGGGLMLRSFWNLAHAPIGFDPSGVVSATAQMSFSLWPTPERRWTFVQEAIRVVEQLPGVERVSAASALPYAFPATRLFGREGDPSTAMRASWQGVAPGYIAVTRTRLLDGRDVSEADIRQNRAVAIIDERIASRLWPSGALNQRLEMQLGSARRTLEIIGVTAPVRAMKASDGDVPHVFLSYNAFPAEPWLAIRTTQSASALAPAIRRAVEPLGGGRPVVDIRPLGDYVEESYGNTRFTMMLLTAFAVVALLLAGIGMYATLAYLTAQRMREFGVRAALGATALSIVSSVVREVAGLAALGAGVGFAVALSAAGSLRGLLYGVAPVDTTTIALVSGLVGVAAILAASLPARRAASVDPTSALRAE